MRIRGKIERCTGKALTDYRSADNWRLTIGRYRLIQKTYFAVLFKLLFRLQLLSENSYLLERLQSADKTKTYPKAKLQDAPTFTRNGSNSHVCLLLVIKIKTCTYQLTIV